MIRWLVAAAVAVVLATGAIVALTHDDSASGSDSEAGVAFAPDSEAFAEFQDCMSENGADVPGPPAGAPTGPGAGPPRSQNQRFPRPNGRALVRPDSKTRAAFEACKDLMPERPGGPSGFPAPGIAPGGVPAPPD